MLLLLQCVSQSASLSVSSNDAFTLHWFYGTYASLTLSGAPKFKGETGIPKDIMTGPHSFSTDADGAFVVIQMKDEVGLGP